MKIFLNDNVWDAALERMRFIFDEFENIVVGFSGGKDSTVTLNLALKVAEEKGRLPLDVVFIDQEAEWRAVVEYCRRVMDDPRTNMYWLQVPIRLFNAASHEQDWLHCWAPDEEAEWMRPKEPNSVKENIYGTDRFADMFNAFVKTTYPEQRVALLGGVRAEESPSRRAGLTTGQTYKHITYGKVINEKHGQYIFYPLYDWGWKDIWKSIHDNGWDYCTIYNEFYRYGIPPMKMRVSNLHHETAVDQLFYLHEMEGDTWNALTARLKGVNQAKHMRKADMFTVKELPWMFNSWREYRDYLVENLIQSEERRSKFRKKYADMDKKFEGMDREEEMLHAHILSILANDWHFTKVNNFLTRPETINFLKWKSGKSINWSRPERDLRYIKPEFRGKVAL